MGGWWAVEARNGNGACGQSNLMRLASSMLARRRATQRGCVSGIYMFAQGEATGGRAWTGFYCLAARTTTSRLRTPFILEVVTYDPYEGLVRSVSAFWAYACVVHIVQHPHASALF